MKSSVIREKSYTFSLNVISLYQYLCLNNKEFSLFKQLLRSGIAICALIYEAEKAESKRDFLHKINIALKESNETLYWLKILYDSKILRKEDFDKIFPLSDELVRLLTSIVKTTKQNL